MEKKPSLEERIQVLEAREEIKELTAKYLWHAVRCETDAQVQLFTRDGVFDARSAGGPYSPKGHEELAKYLAAMVKSAADPSVPTVIPTIHNFIISVDGDEASGSCVFETPIGGRLGGGFIGYYRDKYRRVDGKWLFAERLFDTYADFPKREGIEIKAVKN